MQKGEPVIAEDCREDRLRPNVLLRALRSVLRFASTEEIRIVGISRIADEKPCGKSRDLDVLRVLESAAGCGFEVMGVMRSPIDGGDGNREYLAVFKRRDGLSEIIDTSFLKDLCKD